MQCSKLQLMMLLSLPGSVYSPLPELQGSYWNHQDSSLILRARSLDIYSASHEDKATTFCFCATQVIGFFIKKICNTCDTFPVINVHLRLDNCHFTHIIHHLTDVSCIHNLNSVSLMYLKVCSTASI